MKIWVIGRDYPSLQNRLRGSFEIDQAKMLSRGGHDVTYICCSYHPKRKIKKWGLVEWKEDDIKICACSAFFFPDRMNVRLSAYRSYFLKKTLAFAEKSSGLPDAIHVHYPTMITDPDVILSYRSKGIKVVVTEHWTKVLTKKLSSAELKQLTKYVENADAFLCVGEPLRKSIIEQTKPSKMPRLLPNLVDPVFKPLNTSTPTNAPFTFITASRLVNVKQIDKVIEAIAKLTEKKVSVRYLIIGDGAEREALQAQVRENQLTETVKFFGAQPKEVVAEMISKADCLICYSSLETFGVPIIEAWACGIPVISSDCLGFAEYWKDGLGYIVNHNNLEDLTQKMLQIIGEKEKFNKLEISAYAQSLFSESVIRAELEKIYQE